MYCPYYNSEMKKGYVAGMSILTFSEVYRKGNLLPKKGETVISTNSGSIAHKKCWYCEACSTIIMHNIPAPEDKNKYLYSGVDEGTDIND